MRCQMRGIEMLLSLKHKLHDWLLAVFSSAAVLFALDRGAAALLHAQGEQGLTVLSGISLFGWAALLLLTTSFISAACVLISEGVTRRLSRPSLLPYLFGLLWGIVAAAPFYFVGKDLASGDWISHQSFAWAVHAAPAVLGPAGVALLAWLHLRYRQTDARKRWKIRGVTLLLLFFSLCCVSAIWLLSFGAYPNLQVLLFWLSQGALLAAAYRSLPRVTRAWPPGRLRALSAAAFVLIAVPSVMAFGMNRETRSELMVKSTTMAQVARKTGRMASGSLLENTLKSIRTTSTWQDRDAPLPRGMIRAGEDWNVLLLVVDCMRSDAVPPNRKRGQKHAKPGDTPFLDSLIADSYRFRHAYAQGSRTLQSMPYLFRSLEPYDHPRRVGQPLGTYVKKSLELSPVAVVNDVFMRPWRKPFQELLTGFEHVSIFEEKEMGSQIDRALDILGRDDVRPFFAWLHFHSMHLPYFDGRRLTGRDGPVTTRYRRGLKWLDKQLETLFSSLDEMGITDKTVVILAADHGENLGANNIKSHGFTVFEEAIRVPLAIRIPGRKGHIIDQTVGNIDILPTIADLFGAPINPNHRGRSLLPLMTDPELDWKRSYHTRNAGGQMYSVVRGRDKLIYDAEADTIYRFELSRDPKEDVNLYKESGRLDQELLMSILSFQPKRFADELADEKMQRLLEKTIAELDPKHPGGAIDFLVGLAALAPSEAIEAHMLKIFHRTADDDARIKVQRGMFDTNKRLWKKALVEHLKRIRGTQAEVSYVARLGALGQTAFDHRFAGERLSWWMKQASSKGVDAWLRLMTHWPNKPESHFGKPLAMLLEQLAEKETQSLEINTRLSWVLENISSTEWRADSTWKERARVAAHALFDHPDASSRRSVFKALGAVGDEESMGRLKAILDTADEPVRMRQSALNALVSLQEEDAIPLILKYCAEAKLQPDAIVLLKSLGHVNGIPFLQKIERTHPKGTFRNAARKAIDHILEKSYRERAKTLAQKSLSHLEKMLEKESSEERVIAVMALQQKAKKDKRAIEMMAPLLADSDELVRGVTHQKLVQLGRPAVAPLIAGWHTDYPHRDKTFLVKNRKQKLKTAIHDVLKALKGKAVGGLIEALDHDDDAIRLEAAFTLGRMKTVTDKSVPAMLRHLSDPDWKVRNSLLRGLAALSPKDRKVRQALSRLLEDEDERVRESAEKALSKIN